MTSSELWWQMQIRILSKTKKMNYRMVSMKTMLDNQLPSLSLHKISVADIDVLANGMEKACGPTPDIESLRSFRCRAALSCSDEGSMFRVLEQYPLTQSGLGVPNVIGTYLLHGIPAGTDATDNSKHLVYCGQAMAVKPQNYKAVGLRQRSQRHWAHIHAKSEHAKQALYAHKRFADDAIDRAEIALLSAFPFPRPGMGNALRHMTYIASLAETIDILLLDAVSDASPPLRIVHWITAWIIPPNIRFRLLWHQIFCLKEHLHQQGLIEGPTDNNDLFYHIPELENGLKTAWHITELLKRTGFWEPQNPIFRSNFIRRFLARLLQRDVWEGSARPVLTEQGVYKDSDVPIPSLHAPDTTLIQIWQRARAQMLADGVPSELCLGGGLASHTLAPWAYKPLDNVASEEPVSSQLASANHAQTQMNQEDNGPIEEPDNGEDETETQYVWPSDWARHEALAFTNEYTADGAVPEIKEHRCSTLRVLMHIMRNYHRSTFQGADGTYEQFWETLFVAGLDKKWKIRDISLLKQRFGWVLQFIETGTLPSEAKTAEELLWEALKDNALSYPTHPYNSEAGKTDSWLNLDLSQAWVQKLLWANGSLDHIKKGNSQQEDQAASREVPVSPRGVGELYEIADMALLDHRPADSSLTAAHSQDAPWESTDRLTAQAKQPEVDPEIRPPYINEQTENRQQQWFESEAAVSNSSPPPSPPPYSPLSDETAQDKQNKWEPQEDEYLISLLKTGCTRASRVSKFQNRFGQRRTANAINSRVRKLEKAGQSEKKKRTLTTAEQEYLRELLRTSRNWDEVYSKMQEKFHRNNRTVAHLRHYASYHKMDISALVNRPEWTDEQDYFLKSWRKNNTSLKGLPVLFKEKFGFERSLDALNQRAKMKGFPAGRTNEPFTEEEEQFIRGSLLRGLERKEVATQFLRRFGSHHTTPSILGKMIRVNNEASSKEAKNRPWTAAEIQFLEDWSPPEQGKGKALKEAFDARFGSRRSQGALNSKLSVVEARREKIKNS
ncbi:hypothetical protein ACKAV7_006597 [Fusarium commune]